MSPTAAERRIERRARPRGARLCANRLCLEALPRDYGDTWKLCPSCHAAWRLGLRAGGLIVGTAGLIVGGLTWLLKFTAQ